MTQFTEKAEYIDGNSKVRIVLDGGSATALIQNAAGDIRTQLVAGGIVIGPKPAAPLQTPDLQVAVNPNLPPPKPLVALTIGGTGTHGRLMLLDSNGKLVGLFDGESADLSVGGQDNAGDVRVFNEAGQVTVHLDGAAGDIELLGADCAEEFDIDTTQLLEPGMVMVIAESAKLRACTEAYDRKVAGILSGAGTYRPGIVLGRSHTPGDRLPLALTGRAYCKVDAQYGSIELGDLLTTSATPGHAMKAADPLKAFGTVIGKALQPLSDGQGLIPVLVALQ